MITSIRSARVVGAQGIPTVVEVNVTPGLPGFDVVGRPGSSCRETRDRVRAAVLNSGHRWPNRRIAVNIAPAGGGAVPASCDLAIAVGVLASDGQIKADLTGMAFIGELGLDGSVRSVPGVYPMADSLILDDMSEVVVPAANDAEVRALRHHIARPVESLRELVRCLSGADRFRPPHLPESTRLVAPAVPDSDGVGFASLVAAAGGHHMLIMGGQRGAGEAIARRIADLLPPLDDEMSEAVTSIHSAAGELPPGTGVIRRPPFRSPAPSTSLVGFVGGSSSQLRPGEVSLAHGGVLFLDELGEFAPPALDTLRQPLDEGLVRLSRAHVTAEIPASFQLVAAMPWCSCNLTECRCTPSAIARFNRRIPASLLGRFAIRVAADTPTGIVGGTAVGAADGDVAEVRRRAAARGVRANHYLTDEQVSAASRPTDAAEAHIVEAIMCGRLSLRGVRSVRRVALTIDDLAGGNGEISGAVMALALMLHSPPAATLVLKPNRKGNEMTNTNTTNPNRLTVPTAREIRDALASIPTGKGEPGLNSAILGVAEGARFASRALLHIFPAARGSDAEAPIKAALFALSTTANAFEDCARELVLDMEAERSEMIADGRGADYLDMRGER